MDQGLAGYLKYSRSQEKFCRGSKQDFPLPVERREALGQSAHYAQRLRVMDGVRTGALHAKHRIWITFAAAVCLLTTAPGTPAAEGMAGSRDHPKIPRISGAVIFGYQSSDYDESVFLRKADDKFTATRAGGKRTRIRWGRATTYAGVGPR